MKQVNPKIDMKKIKGGAEATQRERKPASRPGTNKGITGMKNAKNRKN